MDERVEDLEFAELPEAPETRIAELLQEVTDRYNEERGVPEFREMAEPPPSAFAALPEAPEREQPAASRASFVPPPPTPVDELPPMPEAETVATEAAAGQAFAAVPSVPQDAPELQDELTAGPASETALGASQGGGMGGDRELLDAIRELTAVVRELRDVMQRQGGGQGERKPGPQPDGSFVPSLGQNAQTQAVQKQRPSGAYPRMRDQVGTSEWERAIAARRPA